MSWGSAAQRWTDDRDRQLVALHADGLTGSAIAEQLGGGLSRSAVIARLNRLRAQGAAGPARTNPVVESVARRRDEMDRVADAWADGAATLSEAAQRSGLSFDRARDLWAAIKTGLGAQAV